MGSRFYYRDKQTGEFKEGFPPPTHAHFGDAPMIIGDTIDKYYHPGACRWTESRAELQMFDNATGTFTTDKKQTPSDTVQKELLRQRRKDMHECIHKSVAQIDAGTSTLKEETRQLCERQNEIISKALNFDAFNVAGRKTNGRGKKYRRR